MHDAEEIAPDTPAVPEAAIGSEERPFEIVSDEDMRELSALLAESTETVHAVLVDDVVITLPDEKATAFFTVGEGKELVLSLNVLAQRVFRIRVAERGGNVAAYKPRVIVGQDSQPLRGHLFRNG